MTRTIGMMTVVAFWDFRPGFVAWLWRLIYRHYKNQWVYSRGFIRKPAEGLIKVLA